jgi:hypothetical protein
LFGHPNPRSARTGQNPPLGLADTESRWRADPATTSLTDIIAEL